MLSKKIMFMPKTDWEMKMLNWNYGNKLCLSVKFYVENFISVQF